MHYQNHQTVGGHEFWDRLYEGFIRCWMTSHAVEIGFDPAFAWIDDRMPMKDPAGTFANFNSYCRNSLCHRTWQNNLSGMIRIKKPETASSPDRHHFEKGDATKIRTLPDLHLGFGRFGDYESTAGINAVVLAGDVRVDTGGLGIGACGT